MDHILDTVEQSAVGVVDEDQFIAHALMDVLVRTKLTELYSMLIDL